MIIALAGRRVDPPSATQDRFPGTAGNLEVVRKRIRTSLENHKARVLVSSAACGSDLLALEAAGSLGLRRRIVLPFEIEKFRNTSVTDRPGNWGALYDRILSEVQKNADVFVVRSKSENLAYAEVNHAIIKEALSLGWQLQQSVTAMVVWEGKSRGDSDLTEEFVVVARNHGLLVTEVLTV
jgi:hypothetical protein